jgi:hypothetical protein
VKGAGYHEPRRQLCLDTVRLAYPRMSYVRSLLVLVVLRQPTSADDISDAFKQIERKIEHTTHEMIVTFGKRSRNASSFPTPF